MRSDYDLVAIVALESALFFSLPTWIFAVDAAWPASNPVWFGIALVAGASLALLVCHVLPALCGPPVLAVLNSRVPRVIRIVVSFSLSSGAVVSMAQMAQTSGGLSTGWHHDTMPREIAVAIITTITCIVGPLWITWRVPHLQPLVAGFCLIVGVCLISSAVWVNWPGLFVRNGHLISEDALGNPVSVARGMLIAATPAAALALRAGTLRLTTKRIWLTGLIGVWLPLVLSVSACSVAKLCGARLYWRPSVPIDATFAFLWLTRMTNEPVTRLWPLSLACVGPCMVYAIWIQDLTTELSWKWQKPVALFFLAILAYVLMSVEPWGWYYPYPFWYWSVIGALGILASLWLFLRTRSSKVGVVSTS